MKILQINSVSNIGSTGRICTEMAKVLNENENEDECYIAYSGGVTEKKGYKIGSWIEVKLHGLYSRIFGMQGYFSKNETIRLVKYMEELKPDIVHLHNLHANYINFKILLKYLAEKDIPTVLTLHDCWFFTGKCTHYTVDDCYKWKTGCGNCPRLKKDNPSWFFDRTTQMYNDKKACFGNIPRLGVVGVSDWITNEAKKSLLSSSRSITRIYNWIDYNIFKPVPTKQLQQRLRVANKFIVLGVASNWNHAKGLYKFIDLANLISTDTIIVLVGNIPVDTKLPENIMHIKETHNVEELVKYYSMADIFINLSLEETFGKVTAEALACGTPAITINSTANPEVIGEGCGYIIEENLSEILEKLNKVKETGKAVYSESCINYVKSHFDKNGRIKEYTDLYRKLIEL